MSSFFFILVVKYNQLMKGLWIFIFYPALFGCDSARAQKSEMKVDNLVFEGAGIRGIAYCGALEELEKRGILQQADHIAGTSSGAITATLLCLGYTYNEIFDIVGSTDFGKFNDGGWGFAGGLYRLKKKMGFYRGDAFREWLEVLIEKKTQNKNITFSELAALANSNHGFKKLVVASTSLNHQITLYFSAETYPQMRLSDAVRASMAVPLYFEPMIIDQNGKPVTEKEILPEHHICVDGGFTANFCIQYFDSKNVDGTMNYANTLGVRIDSDEQIKLDVAGERKLVYHNVGKLGDYMGAFYNITKENLNRQGLTEMDWARTISVSDGNIGPKVKKLSTQQKLLLIEAGRKGVRNYFERF
jgi:NTE family protein